MRTNVTRIYRNRSRSTVDSMAKQPKEGAAPAQSGEAKGKSKAEPAAKGAEKAQDAAPAAKAKEKPKPAPRPPADPRLKVLKKFRGKFLPKGPLRDRLKSLMERWNSDPEHGGVSLEELKALYDDWKSARRKPARVN
jgi:hypothetical protein